jgi:hypothetical protein
MFTKGIQQLEEWKGKRYTSIHSNTTIKKGQTQCQRLPHEWGLGKGITEAKSYPRRNSVSIMLYQGQNYV